MMCQKPFEKCCDSKVKRVSCINFLGLIRAKITAVVCSSLLFVSCTEEKKKNFAGHPIFLTEVVRF
jgi:hypothetical protein